MGQIQVPAAPATHQWKIESFLGADLTNTAANIAAGRASACPNMIRESMGKVRKRTGFYKTDTFDGQINGIHFFYDDAGTKKIVHAGTKIWMVDGDQKSLLYSEAADARSQSRQLAGRLCILDGKKMLLFGDFQNESGTHKYEIRTAESEAYVPTTIIGREPDGGGTSYEPINLLTPYRTERFSGKANVKVYKVSAGKIDTVGAWVKILQSDGTLKSLSWQSDFSVDREAGTVTFKTAPGVSPVLGKDNVYITYIHNVDGYPDRVNRCRFCTLYGVNGARDRLFITGDPKYPNRDYYSQLNDPTYFGDIWYAQIGQDGSQIMGYSVVGDQLATHLNGSDDDTNIILRRGELEEVCTTEGTTTVLSSTQSSSSSTASTGPGTKVSFRISGSFQGSGAQSPYAFSVLETEPLFAVRGDIMAVTPSDVLGERYAQSRAFYLQGLLRKLDLSDAYACAYNGFYVLAAQGYLLFLDGTQPVFERDAPYATRQYEAYYWTDIHARVVYEQDGALCFGTRDGALYRFHTDYSRVRNFHDEVDGVKRAIYACWQTPRFYGEQFYYRKDFRRISVLLGAAVASGCKIYALYQGEKESLREKSGPFDYDGTNRYFSYDQFFYGKCSYKTDRSPQKILEKIKIKKVESVAFLFENDAMDESFALYKAAVEYTQRL